MAQALPEGFTLDAPQNTNGLPEGFTLDAPLDTQPQEAPAGAIAPKELPEGLNLDTPRKKAAYDELKLRGWVDKVVGRGEAMASIASGAIAEPLAGIAGILGGVSGGEPGQAGKAVEEVRKDLTYQPRTEAGKENIAAIGEFMEPVGEYMKDIETGMGDAVFELTDSPALAAAATAMPTAVLESLGLGAGKKAISALRNIKSARKAGNIARHVSEAVPTKDQLFKVAGEIYDEIDAAGAVVKAEKFDGLVNKISKITKKKGLDPELTPDSFTAMKRFIEKQGDDIKVTDLDVLRKKAKMAAKSIKPADSSVGVSIIDEVDDFFAGMDEDDFVTISGLDPSDIGTKYKVAQDLWGRARKTEMLDRAFRRAREANSGMENGIRNEFKSILLSDKKRKFFDSAELEAMEKVSRGDKKVNLAKLIGRFGWSEGKATNFLGATIGATMGFAASGGNPLLTMAIPMVGQVSKKLAQRMTINNAEFANQTIRAGRNAKKITEAYLEHTAPSERSAEELSELLMRQDIKLNKLPKTDLAQSAKKITSEARVASEKINVDTGLDKELPIKKEQSIKEKLESEELKTLRKEKEDRIKDASKEKLEKEEVASLELTEQQKVDVSETGLEYKETLKNKIPVVRGEIQQMLDEITETKRGSQNVRLKEGKTYTSEGNVKNMFVRLPEWAYDRGWTSKDISTALKKGLEGKKKLTDKQQEIFDVAYSEAEYRHEKLLKNN